MADINYSFSFTHIPPGFKRGAHVALAVFQNNRLLLSRKHAYPEDIFRLLGGGVNPDEDHLTAAARELSEETAVSLQTENLRLKTAFHFDFFETSTGKDYVYDIFLYYIFLQDQTVNASDDVDIITSFNKDEVISNTVRMLKLPETLVKSRQDDLSFRWSDWGKIHGLMHAYVTDNWPF